MLRKEVVVAIYRNSLDQARLKLTSSRYTSDAERIGEYAKGLKHSREFAEAFQSNYGTYLDEVKREHDGVVARHFEGLFTKVIKNMQQRTACIKAAQPLSDLNPRAYAQLPFAA